MLRKILVILAIIVVASVTAAYFVMQNGERFSGRYVGLAKIPGTGWSVVRLTVSKDGEKFALDAKGGRYRNVSETEKLTRDVLKFETTLEDGTRAAGEVPLTSKKEDSQDLQFVWTEDQELHYKATLTDKELSVDGQLGWVITLGRVRGTLVMPGGSVFEKDTPENYEHFKENLRAKIREKNPQAVFKERN